MNSLERVRLILQHKEADRVPIYPIINSVSMKTLGIAYDEWTKNVDLCAESIIKTTEEFDLDCVVTLTDLSVQAADFGQEINYYKDRAADLSLNKFIKSPEDYAKVKRINPRETPRMSDQITLAKKLVQAKGQEKLVLGFVFAPLGIISMMRGASEFFPDLITNPKEVHAAVREITETLKYFCTALIETGVHGIMFDTYGSSSMLSEAMWKEFEGVYMKEVADHVRAQDCMVMVHNCGERPYFDAHIESMDPVAFSTLYPAFECSSFAAMKEKYNDLTIIGYTNPTWLMTASSEEIEEECKREIETLKKDGGFILSTGCEYPATLGFEQLKAIVKAGKKYGRY